MCGVNEGCLNEIIFNKRECFLSCHWDFVEGEEIIVYIHSNLSIKLSGKMTNLNIVKYMSSTSRI